MTYVRFLVDSARIGREFDKLGLGTRVPVAVLFENLADGLTLDEIIDAYPALSRETALLALQQAQALLQRQQATA